jgi:hypothetical protein
MRPPPRDRNALTKYDDSKAKVDEAVKRIRLKAVKRRRINAFLPVPVPCLPGQPHLKFRAYPRMGGCLPG